MTETEQGQRPGGVLDAVRPTDDRMVAGVCAGVARQLGIDPVIVRVAVGVLTIVGGAGLVLYGAAWLVLPDAGTGRSIAQDRLGVGRNEPQVRGFVLVTAGVIAVLTALGLANGGPWDTPFPYVGLVALAVFWWWVVRPHQREQATRGEVAVAESVGTAPTTAADGPPAAPTPPVHVPPRPPNPRHDRGRLTLLALTLSIVAAGVVGLWSATIDPLPWGAYPAAMLAVLGLAMLVGTVVGNARPIALPAILVALVLALAAAVPYSSAGERVDTPTTAADVRDAYTLGMGRIDLDLTQVGDPEALLGRDLTIGNGLGEVRVVVPEGLAVDVDAATRSGEVVVLGATDSGTDARARVETGTPALDIEVRQTAGRVEVERR